MILTFQTSYFSQYKTKNEQSVDELYESKYEFTNSYKEIHINNKLVSSFLGDIN